jgi:DNA-binding CsgD family transcriptional regulator
MTDRPYAGTPWKDLPETDDEIMTIAQRVCTPKELDALTLYRKGLGYRAIGRTLGISRDAARARIEHAIGKIRKDAA